MGADDPDDWMWERARSLLASAEHLHRRAFGLVPPGGRTPAWSPPVDVFDLGRELWVLVALPGIRPEQVRVTAAHDHLLIEGQRGLPEAFRRARVHRLESPYGTFRRRVELPRGSFALEQRELVQGCLVLRFSRTTERSE